MITVFIGANSSGKTNILDALYFVRDWFVYGVSETVFAWQGKTQIQTFGTTGPVEIEVSFKASVNELVRYLYTINFDQSTTVATGRRIDHFAKTSNGKLVNQLENLSEFDFTNANLLNHLLMQIC